MKQKHKQRGFKARAADRGEYSTSGSGDFKGKPRRGPKNHQRPKHKRRQFVGKVIDWAFSQHFRRDKAAMHKAAKLARR